MPGDQYKTLCLYYFPVGPPSRTVMLAAKVLGIDLNLKYVDMHKEEHLKRDYLQINPEHKVPTLTDNGYAIAESRAIITYLADKYGKKESLYPRDPKKRAKINQMLFFDADKLMGNLTGYYLPVFYGVGGFNQEKMQDVKNALKFLDQYLMQTEYVCGDNLTLADLAIISTVATASFVFDFDLNSYAHVQKWFKHLESTLPDFKEIIADNCKKAKEIMEMVIAQRKK